MSNALPYDPWLQAKFQYWFEYVGGDVGLVWKQDSGPNSKAGDGVGHVSADGSRIFKLTYQGYNVASTIVCMHDGWYPKRVKFLDGDKRNFAISNLEGSIPPPTKVTADMLVSDRVLHAKYAIKGEMLVCKADGQLAIDKILPSGFGIVFVNNVTCKIQNVIYQMVHGRFPPAKLHPLDNNKLNLRLSNWTTVKPVAMPSEYPYVRYVKVRNVWVVDGSGPLASAPSYSTDVVAFIAYLKKRLQAGLDVPPHFSHLAEMYRVYLESPRPIPFAITLPPFPHYRPNNVNLKLTRS